MRISINIIYVQSFYELLRVNVITYTFNREITTYIFRITFTYIDTEKLFKNVTIITKSQPTKVKFAVVNVTQEFVIVTGYYRLSFRRSGHTDKK